MSEMMIKDFAKIKDCSRQTIDNAIKRGELDFVIKFGKRRIRNTKRNEEWMPDESKRRSKK